MNYPFGARALLAAVALAFCALLLWELHWRSVDYPIGPNDNKHLWAQQRAKVDDLGPDGVVLIGSSRVFFDFQLDVWEAETGVRPVQLAIAGSSPVPVLTDIAEHSDFAGTLLIGVTEPLFFTPPSSRSNWTKPASWAEHYHDRTYAERLNHFLALPLENIFAFLENTEEDFCDELDLRTLVYQFPTPRRVRTYPPFPSFQYISNDRNVTMRPEFVSDTSRAREVKNVWMFYAQPPPNLPPPEVIAKMKSDIIGMAKEAIDKIRARGGQVILIRCPSSGDFLRAEMGGFPRAENWQQIVDTMDCPAYHFQDYDFMSKYELPEWSHLASHDAKTFTRDFVQKLQSDGLIK